MASEDRQIELRFPFKEDLPLPYVHYQREGTFLSFSAEHYSEPYLCTCARAAVQNYVLLRERSGRSASGYTMRFAPLGEPDFGQRIAWRSLKAPSDPLSVLQFEDGLCHRCNMAVPSVGFFASNTGQTFKSHYGWYVHQMRYRMGVDLRRSSKGFDYLEELCPEQMASMVDKYNQLVLERNKLFQHVGSREHPELRSTNAPEGLQALNRKATKLERQISNFAEDKTREEFGFKKIGFSHVSESILFKIICVLYPRHEVIRHHRPEWLEGLELDLFLPEERLGIEYQGQQHYHPVELWGGEDALKSQQARDARKRHLCRRKGVRLVEIKYTEPLSEAHVRARLQD